MSSLARQSGFIAGKVIGKAVAKKAKNAQIEREINAHLFAYEQKIGDLTNQYQSGMINNDRYQYLIYQAKQDIDRTLNYYESL